MVRLRSSSLTALVRELSLWTAAGKHAVFWLRDDDVSSITDRFERLLVFQKKYRLPMAVAVIPKGLDDNLPFLMKQYPEVAILQHGWSHKNHAPEGQRHSEYPSQRLPQEVSQTLGMGRALLQNLFQDQFVYGIVPPWNHFAREHLSQLKAYAFIAGRNDTVAPDDKDIPSIAADVDILRWKPAPHFRGSKRLIKIISRQLRARRIQNRQDPVGILLHHLQMDNRAWAFIEALTEILHAHPSVTFLDIRKADLWKIAVQNIPAPASVDVSANVKLKIVNSTTRIRIWLAALLADCALPKPAYTLAFVALLGVLIGHILGISASHAADLFMFKQQTQMDIEDMP